VTHVYRHTFGNTKQLFSSGSVFFVGKRLRVAFWQKFPNIWEKIFRKNVRSVKFKTHLVGTVATVTGRP
jgi:hypothetical protein